eukprot:gene16214-18351_t
MPTSSTVQSCPSASVVCAVNKWCHYVMTKQGKKVSIYINKVLASSYNLLKASIVNNGNLPLVLGALNGGQTVPATPTVRPSSSPSDEPTCRPSSHPSAQPFTGPSTHPSSRPSYQPSSRPSSHPSS